MILMQRSSSLILGPEQGWGAEETFYQTILDPVSEGVEFVHIVSLGGIERHLRRPQSTFPALSVALSRLTNADGLVAIRGKSRLMYIKTFSEDDQQRDIKPDRQARVFLVQHHNGVSEGNFVFDIGSVQCSFQLRGSKVELFMRQAIRFYQDQCEYLKWSELERLVTPFLSQSTTRPCGRIVASIAGWIPESVFL